MTKYIPLPPSQQAITDAAAAELYSALYRLVHDDMSKDAWTQARAALALVEPRQ